MTMVGRTGASDAYCIVAGERVWYSTDMLDTEQHARHQC